VRSSSQCLPALPLTASGDGREHRVQVGLRLTAVRRRRVQRLHLNHEVAAVLRALADGDQPAAGRLVHDAADPQGVTRGLLAAIEALASPDHLRTVAAGLDGAEDS
jgi:hypothetical protein